MMEAIAAGSEEVVVRVPEDSRGRLPIQLNMNQAPVIIGGCPLCRVVGSLCHCSIPNL